MDASEGFCVAFPVVGLLIRLNNSPAGVATFVRLISGLTSGGLCRIGNSFRKFERILGWERGWNSVWVWTIRAVSSWISIWKLYGRCCSSLVSSYLKRKVIIWFMVAHEWELSTSSPLTQVTTMPFGQRRRWRNPKKRWNANGLRYHKLCEENVNMIPPVRNLVELEYDCKGKDKII